MPLVEIPDIGTVDFPDSMSREAITATIKDKILAPRKPTLRPQVLPPGETIPTVSRTQPIEAPEQAFPAREQALQDLRRPRPLPETPAPSEAQQQAMLTGVAQPEAEIQPIGKEGTLLRGASSMVAGILNRPEYLAAMANPATAAAVGLRFAPPVAKQFFEDLGKASQGDNEALGRAAVIGIPALLGGIRTGKTITERMNAQVQLERAQAASSAAHIDALSRAGIQGTTGGIEPPITMRPTPGRPSLLTANAPQSNELLTQSAEELAKTPGERKIHGVSPVQNPITSPTIEPNEPTQTGVSSGVSGRGGQPLHLASQARKISEALRSRSASDLQLQLQGPPLGPEEFSRLSALVPEEWTQPLEAIRQSAIRGRSDREAVQAAFAVSDYQKATGKIGNQISKDEIESIIGSQERLLGEGAELQTQIDKTASGNEPERNLGYARENSKAATFYGSLRPQQEPAKPLPVSQGGAGIQPQAEQRLPGQDDTAAKETAQDVSRNVKEVTPSETQTQEKGAQGVLETPSTPEPSGGTEVKPTAATGRNWDTFYEDLVGDLDSFRPARETGKRDYAMDDVAQRFVDYAKKDTTGKALPDLVKEFAKSDDATPSQLRKLKASVKKLTKQSLQESETEPETPLEASAKVETQVQEVARTEGQRPAREIKSELIDRIEQAIEAAPNESDVKASRYTTKDMKRVQMPDRAEMIEINIPGDGNFKIRNTKEALGEILKRAQKISTKSTEGPSISRTGISKEDKAAIEKTIAEGKPLPNPPAKPIGMGGAVPSEFEPGGGTVVSNMFAAIDRDRALNGKPPMEPGEPRTWDQDRQIATARMNRDPNWIPNLIQEVLDKPRPLTSCEQMGTVLQKAYWKAEANNALRRIAQAFEDNRQDDLVEARAEAVRFEDSLARMEEAVGRGGTGSEAGRTLQAQKIGLTDDLSLIEMRLEARARKGGAPLNEAESAKIEQIHKDYQAKLAALEKTAAESDRQRIEAETRATLAELGRQSAEAKVPPPHIQTLIKRVGDTIHTRAEAARERLRGKLFTLSPEVLRDLAEVGADNIWTIGEDFARWSVKMAQDIGDHVKPYLAEVWEASKKLVSDSFDAERTPAKGKKPAKPKEVELAKQTIKQGDTPQQQREKLTARIVDRFSKGELRKITPSVQKLARTFVAEGIRGRDELIDAVHGVLEGILPDWDRRDTMDAISGYGDYKSLSKDEVSVALRNLKGQMQQIAKLEDMAGGEAPLRTGLERRELTQAQQALIRLVNEAKRKGGYETTDPTTQLRTALDEVKKRTETQIAEYQRRLDEKDFSVRKLTPIKPDNELIAKQADLKRVRKQWDQAKREWDNANRKEWQKTLDRFVRWERAFKLSSPVVFGKLTAAALTRVATTLTEEAVGTGLRLVPGIRAVAKQAPREGGALNVSAFSKALAQAVTQGMKDAWQTARKGAADVDVQYGEKIIDKDWLNIFGQLHGMLKAPVKRLEIEYSLAKRIEFNLLNGVDVTDKMVMERLMAEAVNDGFRSIFMQRGFTSDSFNNFVGMLEKSKKYPVAGEISARTLRFLLPIVRVPANIVAETSTGIYGAPLASARVLTGVIRGTLKDMKPEVADAVMRQFKKGSIGLGLMAIGFLNPQSIGGFDWREKRAPGSVKTAGFQVGGVDIPRWMTHAPWFELMQFGATIRHVADQHVARTGEAKGIPEGLWAAGLGLVEETPLVNEMLAVDKLFNPYQRSQFLGEMLRGTLVPQAIQKVATMTDTDIDGPIQRKASTVGEQIKLGIPGLRQSVPERAAP